MLQSVPRLWEESVEAHRAAVRDATLDAAATLVAERGLASVTMSEIAQRAGIGRGTLYKYFPDVDAVLAAWHDRQISGHLAHLSRIRDLAGTAAERLEAVLTAWAQIVRESQAHGDAQLAALLHRDENVQRAQRHLRAFVRDLVAEGAGTGELRDDVGPDELAAFCLHALTAAGSLPSEDAVSHLVAVALAGLRPT